MIPSEPAPPVPERVPSRYALLAARVLMEFAETAPPREELAEVALELISRHPGNTIADLIAHLCQHLEIDRG